jgi:hypothetical protein
MTYGKIKQKPIEPGDAPRIKQMTFSTKHTCTKPTSTTTEGYKKGIQHILEEK